MQELGPVYALLSLPVIGHNTRNGPIHSMLHIYREICAGILERINSMLWCFPETSIVPLFGFYRSAPGK